MIDKQKQQQLERLAQRIRIGIVSTGYGAGLQGAHFGGCLSLAEILATLYTDFVRRDPTHMDSRDRVVLSKGHAALALYCALHEQGLISMAQLATFEHNGSHLVAHARRDLSMGLEFSGGSLSLGLGWATGVALACKRKHLDSHIYAIVGDGELNEGLVWESLMLAAHYKLNNLTVIIDHNHLQADGTVEQVMDTAPLADKLRAFGLSTQQVDGHSVAAIHEALSCRSDSHPQAIIAETVKGRGVSFMENKAKWHHGSLNEKRYEKALNELSKEP